jgi:hypothetical protein
MAGIHVRADDACDWYVDVSVALLLVVPNQNRLWTVRAALTYVHAAEKYRLIVCLCMHGCGSKMKQDD